MYYLIFMYRRLLATVSHLGFYVLHYGISMDLTRKIMFLIKAVFNLIFVVVLLSSWNLFQIYVTNDCLL